MRLRSPERINYCVQSPAHSMDNTNTDHFMNTQQKYFCLDLGFFLNHVVEEYEGNKCTVLPLRILEFLPSLLNYIRKS